MSTKKPEVKLINSVTWALASYCAKTKALTTDDFKFGYLRTVACKSAQVSFDDDVILEAIAGLVAAGLYKPKLTFMDPASEEYYVVSEAEWIKLSETGEYYHPECPDELVDNPESHIIVSYTYSIDALRKFEEGEFAYNDYLGKCLGFATLAAGSNPEVKPLELKLSASARELSLLTEKFVANVDKAFRVVKS